jgi:hypothetical protein
MVCRSRDVTFLFLLNLRNFSTRALQAFFVRVLLGMPFAHELGLQVSKHVIRVTGQVVSGHVILTQ